MEINSIRKYFLYLFEIYNKVRIIKLILLLLPLFTYSQQLKVYNGEYDLGLNPFSEKGNATYNYFENESFERIKEGVFSFKGKTLKIDGQYKNGLRNGLWKFTITSNTKYLGKNPYVILATANYKNGMLHGKCVYTKSILPSKKILETSTAFFNENILVGNYLYIKNPEFPSDKKISINYSQDSLGQLQGEYRAEIYDYDLGNIEDIVKYKNGKMIFRLCREKNDGKIYFKFENGKYTKSIPNYYSTDVFGTNWNAHIGADFWIGGKCQYCGTAFNPIYTTNDGIIEKGFVYFVRRKNIN